MRHHDGKLVHVDHATAGRAPHEVLRFRGVDRLAGSRIL
jgi:hypothetical protein